MVITHLTQTRLMNLVKERQMKERRILVFGSRLVMGLWLMLIVWAFGTRVTSEDEDWIYYSHRKSDVGCSVKEDSTSLVNEPPIVQSSKRSILPWRKRKQIFRSPKAKGEPLLKKAYAEEGGDDIDFDRRQLSSDESISFGVSAVFLFALDLWFITSF